MKFKTEAEAVRWLHRVSPQHCRLCLESVVEDAEGRSAGTEAPVDVGGLFSSMEKHLRESQSMNSAQWRSICANRTL